MKTDNTIFLMGRICEKANKFLLSEMAKLGLSGLAPSHGDVLANLFRCDRTTMTQLSKVINRDPSTVTALVAKLRALGFVETGKDSADSRVTCVFLTEKGRALAPNFDRISRGLFEREYTGVTEEEKAQLKRLLAKISGNF